MIKGDQYIMEALKLGDISTILAELNSCICIHTYVHIDIVCILATE